jgi:opacity protein-like surface antigen
MLSLRQTLVAAAAALPIAMPGAAQEAPPRVERPYRGVFGGGVGAAEESLILNGSLGSGYDDNLLLDEATVDPTDPGTARSGLFTTFSGDLGYNYARGRLALGAAFGAAVRYYPDSERQWLAGYNGVATVGLQVTRSIRVAGSHTTTYQPYYTFAPFVDLGPPGTLPPAVLVQDFRATRAEFYSHASGVELTTGLTRRASLMLNYGYARSELGDPALDMNMQNAGGRLSFALTRGLALRAGYAYSTWRHLSLETDRLENHTVDAGIDYSRGLSISRRTRVGFSAGSSATVEYGRRYYTVIGSINLDRDIRRTWDATLSYSRNIGFVETFAHPLLYDTVAISAGGLITRRIRLATGAGVYLGREVGVGNGDLRTSYATAGTGYALTRHLALGLDYTFHRYGLIPGELMPHGVARELNRHSVRATLNIWVPLIYRTARPVRRP